jgi:protoheme IX farnesyltransferase
VESSGVISGGSLARTHPAISEASVADYFALLKPRVMSLVLFTAFVGLFIAPAGQHPVLSVIALICIAVGAGAAGALNMWYEADIDALMTRTRLRPIPQGRIAPDEALAFGLVLSVGSVAVLGLATNWLAAFLLAFTIAFYVVVYTIWLKRRTAQNIVIGGAAGALPPLVGWTAACGTIDIEPLILFAIIFLWTPSHFWALALAKSQDYARAGIPMLPVVAGDRATRRQILLYALLLFPVTLTLPLFGFASVFYGFTALAGGGLFVGLTYRLWRSRAAESLRSRFAVHIFAASILYLFLLFAALLIEEIMNLAPMNPIAMNLG